MDKHRKDLLLENLSAAAVLGVMGLFVASLAFVFDRVQDGRDASSISTFAGQSSVGSPERFSDPAFSRVYPISRRGREFYGAVATFGGRAGMARVALVFGKDGSLDSAGVVDAVPAGVAIAREGWFTEFLGKGGDIPYPRTKEELKKADAVSGATESFETTAAVLDRLSKAVSAVAADAAKD